MSFRRVIPRLLLCLALGLLTTIAIAWASAAVVVLDPGLSQRYSTPISDSNGNRTVDHSEFGGFIYSRMGTERVTWSFRLLVRDTMGDLGPTVFESATRELPICQRANLFPRKWGRAPELSAADFHNPHAEWTQDARGWPALALCCEWGPTPTARGSPSPAGGFALSPTGPTQGPRFSRLRALPYRPIWTGLLADTLLFALAWSTLLYAPRTLRRRIRLARTQCPRCAYNLAGLPPQTPCPECGQPSRTTPTATCDHVAM